MDTKPSLSLGASKNYLWMHLDYLVGVIVIRQIGENIMWLMMLAKPSITSIILIIIFIKSLWLIGKKLPVISKEILMSLLMNWSINPLQEIQLEILYCYFQVSLKDSNSKDSMTVLLKASDKLIMTQTYASNLLPLTSPLELDLPMLQEEINTKINQFFAIITNNPFQIITKTWMLNSEIRKGLVFQL